MGFGRKWLEEVLQNEELSEKEKAQKIMDEHLTVFNPLKDERDQYKGQAADLQKQLEELSGGENWQEKFEKEHQSFEDFKKQIANEAEAAKMRAAYRNLLVEEQISAKRLDSIMRVTDFTKMKLNKEGRLENEEELRKSIGDEWGEFRTTITEKGAKVETPPVTNNAGKMSREEIYKRDEHGKYVLSAEERQKAIMENPQEFRKG